MNDEIPKYKKKSKHTPPKKSDHKHNKVKCIVKRNFIYGNKPDTWYMLGWYCPICNKVQGETFEWGVNLEEKYPELKVVEIDE